MTTLQEESQRAVDSTAVALKKKIQEMEIMEQNHRRQEKVWNIIILWHYNAIKFFIQL